MCSAYLGIFISTDLGWELQSCGNFLEAQGIRDLLLPSLLFALMIARTSSFTLSESSQILYFWKSKLSNSLPRSASRVLLNTRRSYMRINCWYSKSLTESLSCLSKDAMASYSCSRSASAVVMWSTTYRKLGFSELSTKAF